MVVVATVMVTAVAVRWVAVAVGVTVAIFKGRQVAVVRSVVR